MLQKWTMWEMDTYAEENRRKILDQSQHDWINKQLQTKYSSKDKGVRKLARHAGCKVLYIWKVGSRGWRRYMHRNRNRMMTASRKR